MVGIQMNSEVSLNQDDFNYPINRDFEVQEINNLTDANEDIKQRVEELSKLIEDYEKERATESIPLSKLRTEVNQYKLLAGYTPVTGPGIIITIEGDVEENIAEIVERRKYLINLVNELKAFGGEVISVNDFRITARSEIIQAGNHIVVNGTSIAPPYVVKAIGDVNSFKRYVEYRTLLFESMMSDGIRTNADFSDEIEIRGINREKPMQFLKSISE